MGKIILQPMASKVAYEHYVNTILNPVPIDIIKKHVDESIYNQVREQYPDGKVYIWGVVNGDKNINQKRWEKITRGDITLFSKKEVFLQAQ